MSRLARALMPTPRMEKRTTVATSAWKIPAVFLSVTLLVRKPRRGRHTRREEVVFLKQGKLLPHGLVRILAGLQQARLVALQLGVKGLLRELGLVGRLGGAGEVDDGVRVGSLAQLLEATSEDVVVVGERRGPLAGIAAQGREPRLLNLDLPVATAHLANVLCDAVDLDLAHNLGDAVETTDGLGLDRTTEVGGAAFGAVVGAADVGRVGVRLGDEEVAVRQARREELPNRL